MIDYNKYIYSTGTHYIANSGSDENGKYHGGQAGDQTGREWQLRSWYNRPWSCVLRHPDPRVRRLIAEFGIEAALNDKIGYDQYQRTTFWAALKAAGYRPANITTPCEEDCTAGVAAIVKAIGYLLGIAALQGVSIDAYSGDLKSVLKAAGFEVITESKYRTGYAYNLPGDVLLYEGHHAAINVTRGAKATGEVAEHVDAGSVPAPAENGGSAAGKLVVISNCKSANIRSGPGTQYGSVGTCRAGDAFAAVDTEGWVPVAVGGQVRWISAKYAKEGEGA